MNVDVGVKNYINGVLVNIIIYVILVRVIVNVIRHVKLTNTYKLKIVHAKIIYLVKRY